MIAVCYASVSSGLATINAYFYGYKWGELACLREQGLRTKRDASALRPLGSDTKHAEMLPSHREASIEDS